MVIMDGTTRADGLGRSHGSLLCRTFRRTSIVASSPDLPHWLDCPFSNVECGALSGADRIAELSVFSATLNRKEDKAASHLGQTVWCGAKGVGTA